MTKPAISEDELQHYVDGRVSAERRAQIEAWLAADAELSKRIARYCLEREQLSTAWNAVLDEPIPDRMTAVLSRRERMPKWPLAAALACLVVGALLGWVGRGVVDTRITPLFAGGKPAFYRQAALAHSVYTPEVRHPVEVGADQQDHLVKWLSKRLGSPLNVPNLSAQGYKLVGGRLLPASTGAGAQFMFEDAKGMRLTLYVSGDKSGDRGVSGDTAFRFAQENKISVFYWIDGPFGYALSGEVEREKLLTIANVVYKQLNP